MLGPCITHRWRRLYRICHLLEWHTSRRVTYIASPLLEQGSIAKHHFTKCKGWKFNNCFCLEWWIFHMYPFAEWNFNQNTKFFMYLKLSSAKWRPFCSGEDALTKLPDYLNVDYGQPKRFTYAHVSGRRIIALPWSVVPPASLNNVWMYPGWNFELNFMDPYAQACCHFYNIWIPINVLCAML